jgi:hypothetical protein
MSEQPTRPDKETRATEREEAERTAGADRDPTPEEESQADSRPLGEGVSEHEKEMGERGANQQGEGRLP